MWIKDSDAVLDYAIDWTEWLSDGETITSHVVTVPDGLTKDDDSEADGVVTVWLSGGAAGSTYRVSCLVTTSGGRTDERSQQVAVRER